MAQNDKSSYCPAPLSARYGSAAEYAHYRVGPAPPAGRPRRPAASRAGPLARVHRHHAAAHLGGDDHLVPASAASASAFRSVAARPPDSARPRQRDGSVPPGNSAEVRLRPVPFARCTAGPVTKIISPVPPTPGRPPARASIQSSAFCKNQPARSPEMPPNCFCATWR